MKNSVGIIIGLVLGLLSPKLVRAQGIVYLSNVGQTSTGSRSVGSNLWLAESFLTGTNPGGYLLNSVQLAMTNASGNPNGFNLMLYTAILQNEFFPSNSLGILNGSDNPATSGISTYTPASNLTLSPRTPYFLVLTAGTTVANGAYEWSLASLNYNPSGGWFAPTGSATIDIYQSSNGSIWTPTFMNPQFAITASPIPEPGVSSLFALGGMCCLCLCRKRKALE